MNPRARVLYIGRDAADASLLDLVLSREVPGTEVVHVTDAVAFGREIERADFDMVVCDERFDWGTAAWVVPEVRGRRPGVSVAVLTETAAWQGAESPHTGSDLALAKSSGAFLALPELLRGSLERAAAEEGVSRLEPRICALLERSGIAVFRLTLDGRLLEADDTFLRIVGARSLEEARARSFASLTPRLPRGFTESGKVYKRRQQLRGYRDEDLRVSLVQVVGRDGDGQPVLDGLLEELGGREQPGAEGGAETSRLLRSNEELRRFASMAAHELKEPLRSIEQSTRMLLDDVGASLDGGAGKSARQVIAGVERLQAMIEGLLTLARFGGGEGRVEPCDCNEIVGEVLDTLRARVAESGAEVSLKALPTVRADPMQLRLLFRNLIANAIDFHGESPPRVRIAARQQDDDWVFSVEDEGVGVPAEDRERIFRHFARSAGGLGAGLGLTICKQVVERHGGRIWVESEPDRGSTFYFTIPLSAGSESDSPEHGGQEATAGWHESAQGESG